MNNWLSAIMDPLKSAGETAKGLIDIRDTVKFGNAVIELQAQIMDAQQGASAAQARESALAEEVRNLKARMAEFEAWDADKQRYKLHDFGGETFAYILKEGESNGEPAHRICAHCYQQGHRSILQFRLRNAFSQDVYDCPACKTEFHFGVGRDPPMATHAISDYDPIG
ncbi:MAG: hypothetical protein IIA00_10135 [Proteobacteria bacterium]|nr:hypothetical protein [Pseudomonadota bacterium]